MFTFTTTNVINSDKDLTTGKALWSGTAATEGVTASFEVKRVGKFLGPNVVSIYKAVANDPEMAKVTINLGALSTAKKGESYRLSIYVGLTQASQESRYANDLIFKGKPFTVDFVWKDSATNTVSALIKTINKYSVMVYGEKLLNVSGSGNYLTIEATNEYQRFRKVNIEKFDGEAYFGRGDYNVVRSLEDLSEKESSALTGEVEGYFKGKEGFGTYSYLLHNLRIPTTMRTRVFGINQDENPIIGAKYNQYTLRYCTDRGVLGTNAVGDTVKSVTTHVFYVNTQIASSFETELAKIAPAGGLVKVPAEPSSSSLSEPEEEGTV